MEFIKVGYKDYCDKKDFYYEQIPLAQNTPPEYVPNVYEHYIESLKSHENNFIMTAQEDGQVIGCALFRYYEQENKYFVINVNTRKEYQHTAKKVATNVMLAGMKEFFKFGDELNLWVGKDNYIAQKMYVKLGFEINEGYYPKNLDFLRGGEEFETLMYMTKDKYKSLYQKENKKVPVF